jgi:hypothetical protein
MVGAVKVYQLEPDRLTMMIVLLAEQHFQSILPIGIQEYLGTIP